MITRYLEKINFVPRVAEKVSGSIPHTYLTTEEKQIILRMHDSCFYCNANALSYYMDHVVPFNFIYQTEIFNIVPACINCNSKKSDRLPTQEIFDRVKDRNNKLRLRNDYTKDWYQKLYESCLTFYQGNRLPFSPSPYRSLSLICLIFNRVTSWFLAPRSQKRVRAALLRI